MPVRATDIGVETEDLQAVTALTEQAGEVLWCPITVSRSHRIGSAHARSNAG